MRCADDQEGKAEKRERREIIGSNRRFEPAAMQLKEIVCGLEFHTSERTERWFQPSLLYSQAI